MSNQIETHNQKSLGVYLKKKRVERGLTQSEVASKLGYGSPQFISNIERGISSVPLKSLKVIIDLYQLPADEVLDVLVAEKKNYWKEQLGISTESNESLGQSGAPSMGATFKEDGPQNDRSHESSTRRPEERQQRSDEDTPILFSSNQDRSRDTEI